MHNRELAFEKRIPEVRVEIGKLRCDEHAFVDNDAGRKRGNVELFEGKSGSFCFLLDVFSENEKAALEIVAWAAEAGACTCIVFTLDNGGRIQLNKSSLADARHCLVGAFA